MSKRKKWHTEEGRRFSCTTDKPCDALKERTDENANGMHIYPMMFINLRAKVGGKNAVRFGGYAIKRNRKDRGLCMNWCPFCGADYGPLLDRTGGVVPHPTAVELEAELSKPAKAKEARRT